MGKNLMDEDYPDSTIRQAYIAMGTMFKSALMNDIIEKHPIYKLCDEAWINRFCMHALRHTYATRAIERSIGPKVLQKLLRHASTKTIMDRYVHVTEDSMLNAIKQFESQVIA